MTTAWPRRKIGEIAQHSLGKMLDRARNQGEPKPYLRNQNVRWFGFDLSDLNVMGFKPEEEAKYTAVKGDVLICEGGYPGRAAIWDRDEPIHFQKAIHRVRFHEPDRNKWFLYYLCAMDADGTLRDHLSGTGIQHFTGEALDALEMPLPPVGEQQRMVGILDQAFAAIVAARQNAERNLSNARAVFSSHLESIFANRCEGWVERRLGQLGSTQTGSTPKTADRANYGDVIPFVKPADFRLDGSLNYECDGLSAQGLTAARRVATGSVLMVCIGATIGKCGYCTRDVTTNQQINAMTPNSGIAYKFIYYQMLTAGFQRSVVSRSGRATLPVISKSKWNELPVWLPSTMREQESIAERLDELADETRRLGNVYKRRLAALDELWQSLLHRAFSGQL